MEMKAFYYVFRGRLEFKCEFDHGRQFVTVHLYTVAVIRETQTVRLRNKTFLCSTEMSMKFQLRIKLKC